MSDHGQCRLLACYRPTITDERYPARTGRRCAVCGVATQQLCELLSGLHSWWVIRAER